MQDFKSLTRYPVLRFSDAILSATTATSKSKCPGQLVNMGGGHGQAKLLVLLNSHFISDTYNGSSQISQAPPINKSWVFRTAVKLRKSQTNGFNEIRVTAQRLHHPDRWISRINHRVFRNSFSKF